MLFPLVFHVSAIYIKQLWSIGGFSHLKAKQLLNVLIHLICFIHHQEQLAHHDFTKFNPIKPKLLETVDKMLAEDIARLMAQIPQEEELTNNTEQGTVKGEICE